MRAVGGEGGAKEGREGEEECACRHNDVRMERRKASGNGLEVKWKGRLDREVWLENL
jgi:hypothetical protein